MKLRKKDAKRIAKYLAKNIDVMKFSKKDVDRISKYLANNMERFQFNMTLGRAAGDYAGEWTGRVGDASGVNSLVDAHSIAVEPFSDGYSVSDSNTSEDEDDLIGSIQSVEVVPDSDINEGEDDARP